MKDLKYFIAFIAPLSALYGVIYGGFWSPSAFYVAFVLIPLIELLLPGTGSVENPYTEVEESRSKQLFFDILLYANLPLLYSIIVVFLYRITMADTSTAELVGMTLSAGIACGAIGINVAHELGHRETWYEQLMAKTLLLSSLYMHFFIEHNRGHHKNVATDADPASARLNEPLYAFWLRSVREDRKSVV